MLTLCKDFVTSEYALNNIQVIVHVYWLYIL